MKGLFSDTTKTQTADQGSDGGLSNHEVEIPLRKRQRKGKAQVCRPECEERINRLELQVQDLKEQNKHLYMVVQAVYDQKVVLPFPEMKLIGIEFMKNAEKIIGWLENPQPYMIGVCGMGGVGKTTLLRYIHNEVIDTLSHSVYWIDASQCDNMYKWQRSIATCFGLDLLDWEHEIIRSAKLYWSLVQLGNVVLILDGIWESFSAAEVGLPLGKNGWKFILTTRSFDVCRKMKCKDFVVKVDILSDDEAQELFIDKHENYGTLTQEVKNEAKRIVRLCEGLPLGIITMADCMNGVVDVSEWKKKVVKLESCDEENMKDKVLSKLHLSYDRLDDKMVQNCFLSSMLYLQHFGESYSYLSMCKDKLINLWIHEGLLDEIGGKEKRRREGHGILNELVNSYLLRNSPPNNLEVEMHHLVCNMATRSAQKSDPGLRVTNLLSLEEVLEDDDQWGVDLIKVLGRCDHYNEIQCNIPPRFLKLKVLVLRGIHLDKVVVPDSFFLHMKALRILDLSFMEIERVPNSVSDLTNLRVLLLRYCKNLKYMPSLAKLMKLRVLDLSYCFGMREVPTGMESLKCLEELNYNWNISDLTNFNQLVQCWQFSSFLCYDFVLHDGVDDCGDLITEVGLFNKKLIIIELDLDIEDASPLLPHDLEELRILNCNIEGRGSLGDALPSFSDATNLKELVVYSCEGMKYIATHQEHSNFLPLNTLQRLTIMFSEELEAIIKIEGSENGQTSKIALPVVTFSHLKHLTIKGCSQIKNIFALILVPTSLHFPKLEEVSIEGCMDLEEIYESINDIYCDDSLPNLKALHLCDLPKLGSVFMQRLLCTSLTQLEIFECKKIKEVFPMQLLQNGQSLFPNLQIIKVRNCENLEVIFDSSNNGTSSILVLPSLRTLSLRKLPKLVNIYRGVLLCTCLEEIIIKDCPSYQLMEQLSKLVICDWSESTLISIPTFENDKGYWEPLQNYPEDKDLISNEVVSLWKNRKQNLGATYMPSQTIVNVGNQSSVASIKEALHSQYSPAGVGMPAKNGESHCLLYNTTGTYKGHTFEDANSKGTHG